MTLGTMDIAPFTAFQKVISTISDSMNVRESSVQLWFNGKRAHSHEKPFNIGIKPEVPATVEVKRSFRSKNHHSYPHAHTPKG